MIKYHKIITGTGLENGMSNYKRLIFVSSANTSRSAMAEAIFKSLNDSIQIDVLSRGLVVLFEEPANPKAEAVLNNHELTLGEHVSKQLTKQDYDDETLILTMNERQRNSVSSDYPQAKNVYTITEFAGEIIQMHDPYGGDLAEYEKCYQELVIVVKKVIFRLSEMREQTEGDIKE